MNRYYASRPETTNLECPMIGADLAAKYEERNESGFRQF